ncbi:MAG: hypothetical protein IBJ09_01245 [Bacteroidia bacterium]|nr:hypothetical protein [Bacteroidia bacterium]
MDAGNLVFEFSEEADRTQLHLFTINSKHQQRFLFHSSVGYTKMEALVDMLQYVKEFRNTENSYTIQWSLKGDNSLHTSYFRAKDIFQALEKFSFGRDRNTMVVFSITLNPLS